VLGAQGYVEAGEEILAQLPGLTSAVVAIGSGGTMAGLVLALGAERVLGVHCGAVPDPEQTVAHLVSGLCGDQPGLRLGRPEIASAAQTTCLIRFPPCK
jgi:L-cysteate sulfo-lyase